MARKGPIILRAAQNIESTYTVLQSLDGLTDMLTIAAGVGKSKTMTGKRFGELIKESLAEAIDYYGKQVEQKIHYEATMYKGMDSMLRHLYAGGNPKNMGDVEHKLFDIRKREYSASKGFGYEFLLEAQGKDTQPAVSDLTGSDRRIEYNRATDTIDFSEDRYPAWPDRAEVVYSGFGVTVGQRNPDGDEPMYIVSVKPRAKFYTSKPPQFVFSKDEFINDYSQYGRMFKSWFSNELRVSGFEIINAFDNSTAKGLLEAINMAEMLAKAQDKSTGLARASAKTATMADTQWINTHKKAQEVSGKMADKVGREFYRVLNRNLKREYSNIRSVSDKPAPKVTENAGPTEAELIEAYDYNRFIKQGETGGTSGKAKKVLPPHLRNNT